MQTARAQSKKRRKEARAQTKRRSKETTVQSKRSSKEQRGKRGKRKEQQRDDLTNNEVDDLQQRHPRSPHRHTELLFGRDRRPQFRVICRYWTYIASLWRLDELYVGVNRSKHVE